MTAEPISLRELNRATLARQGLLEPIPSGPVATTVERLGSLQAQHPGWPPFALETRCAAPRADALARARARRSVVRASLMRLTVHVVSAADFWPMSVITRPFRLDQWRLLFKMDPLTSPLGRRIAKAHPAVLDAMRDSPLAIAQIERILAGRLPGVDIPPNRSLWRHFSGSVPLVLVPFSDEAYGRARYLPAAAWLGSGDGIEMDEDEAATHVVRRYLGAFGPASVDDLVAYVGRGRGGIGRWRKAIERLERDGALVAFTDDGGRLVRDLTGAPRPGPDVPAPPRLLARWDSLLLAYGTRDRARILPTAHQSTVITRNADVLPTFLLDGMVAGTWLPRLDDGERRIELRPFGRLSPANRRALEAEAARLLPVLDRGAFGRYPGTD